MVYFLYLQGRARSRGTFDGLGEIRKGIGGVEME